MTEVIITTRGLGAAQRFAADLPKISKPVVARIVGQVMRIGIEAMQQSVSASVGEKSTGAMEASITGEVITISDSEYLIRVGSPLDYARHAIRPYTAPTAINRPVKIMEGRWRFIGMRRGFTVHHPWIPETTNAMKEATLRLFAEEFGREARKVFRQAEAKQDLPDPPGAWFWEV